MARSIIQRRSYCTFCKLFACEYNVVYSGRNVEMRCFIDDASIMGLVLPRRNIDVSHVRYSATFNKWLISEHMSQLRITYFVRVRSVLVQYIERGIYIYLPLCIGISIDFDTDIVSFI